MTGDWNQGDMDERRSSVAKRTRAKTRDSYEKMMAEYHERKQREQMERESEKSRDHRAMDAEVKNGEESEGEEVMPNKVHKRMGEAVKISQNGRNNEEKGEEINTKKLNKRKRDTVKRCENGFHDDEGSGSDVEILGEEKVEEVNPNKLNKGMRTGMKAENGCDDDEGNIFNLGEKGKVEEVNPNKLNKRRKTAKKDENDCDDDEGRGSDIFILGEKKEEEELRPNKLNKRRREPVEKDEKVCDDSEGSGSDIKILREEFVPPSFRIKHVNGGKHFPCGAKRGRSDGIRTTETRGSGIFDRGRTGDEAEEKERDVIIENLDDLESESSSSEDDSDDNDPEEEESVSSDTQSHGFGNQIEDDLEGEENKDDGKMSPAESCFIEEREQHSEDEGSVRKTAVNDDKENSVSGGVISVQKMRGSEGSLKKRKVHTLDTKVDSSKRDEVRRSRLLRLRPRLRSVSESRKKKLIRLGTSENCPVSVSEDEDSDLSDEDGDYDNPVQSTKSRRKVEKIPRRRPHGSPDPNFINILLDSMLKEDNTLKEKLAPLEEKSTCQNVLPLKFRFEDEDPAPPEKEEWEKEIDNLFAEMEMCLTIPSPDSTTQADNDDVTAKAKNPAERCLLGEHQLILEEPTGIICKCCQLVYMEMKDIFPDLKIQSPGRCDWVDFRGGDCCAFDELHLGDLTCKNYYTSILAEGSVLNLIPADVRMSMYEHQLDGFLFLWKNIAGETCIEKLKSQLSDDGRGCIISHAPGTGKTCLTIVFILSLMKIYPMCRPLIIAPRSMLLTWEAEFQKWGFNIPFHNLNSKELSGNENEFAKNILQKMGNDKRARQYAKLYCWMNERSVLGTSYHLFERLASGRKKEAYVEKVRKILLEQPGLVVLDEGHTPRNHQSLLWKVLTEVKTRRRIILSGTPFQNNFDELYNTLCLVNPKLSDKISSESCRDNCRKWRRKSNVEKERWVSLTHAIDKKSDDAIKELKAMIYPFSHVYKGTILQDSLPGLKDTLVILRPTDQQKRILQLIPDGLNHLDKTNLLSLISVHPSLAAEKEFSVDKNRLRELESNPDAGVKVKFVMELIRLSISWREKVLVFSEYIPPLRFIMKQLEHKFSWREGKEVLFMDGTRDVKDRQSSIRSLNDPTSEVKVLLASTKACCEGINLVGASRVVLLDVVWNPSVEKQAISRAYRLGQKKLVYVYHLITSETLDFDKYNRQANKDRLSELVFSCRERQDKSKISSTVAEDKILEAMLDNKLMNDIIENIVHHPRDSNSFANIGFDEHKQ